jgi:hypothetical protein
MVNIPMDIAQITDRQLYELISNLRSHRSQYGHGRSDEAATVRRYVKVEMRRVRAEMRARGLNVHNSDAWRFPGVTADNAQRDADWRDEKQTQADALV